MTSTATFRKAKTNRRRWACPGEDCNQTRITPLSTTKAPICPHCRRPMDKRRRVTR
jgi:hypothetical protein